MAPGKTRWKSLNDKYAFDLGTLIARLQLSGQDINMINRNYLLADGLVGTDTARFFNLEQISNISIEEQKLITTARRVVYEKLK